MVIKFENTKFKNVKFEGNISFEGAMFDATSIKSLMKAFQKAREQDKNLKINLDGISLTKGVTLRGVDFSGASLKNADFSSATNLAGANFEGVDLEGAQFTCDALVAAKTQDNKKVSQELRKGMAEFVINRPDEQELLEDALTNNPNAATSLYLFREFANSAVGKYFRGASEEAKEGLFVQQSALLFTEVAAKIKEKSGLADVLLKHMSNALVFYQSQKGDAVFQDKTLDDMKSGMSTVVAMLKAYEFAAQEKDKNPSRYVIPFIAMDKIALEIVGERFEGDVIAGLVMDGISKHLCHTMHKIIRDNPSGDIYSFMKNGRFAELAERLRGYYNDAMILDMSVGALGNWKLDEVILKQQDEKISHEIREFMEQDVNLDKKDVSDLNAVSNGVSDLLFGKGSEKNRAEEVKWINNSLQNVFRELKFEDKEFIPAMVVSSDLSREEIFLERKGVNDIVQEINGKLLQEIKDLYYKATWYAYGGLGLFTSSVKIRKQNDLKKVELELKNLLRNKIMDRIVSDGEKASIRNIAELLNGFYNPSEKEVYKGAKFNAIYSKLLEGFIKAKARGMTDSLDLKENERDLSGILDCIIHNIIAQNPKKMPNDFADYFRGDNLAKLTL